MHLLILVAFKQLPTYAFLSKVYCEDIPEKEYIYAVRTYKHTQIVSNVQSLIIELFTIHYLSKA